MPTLVYCVHGMGCGTPSDGAAHRPWSESVVAAVRWIASTYGLSMPAVVEPPYDHIPPGSDDPFGLWIVPVSYSRPFDEFRASSADRAALLKENQSLLRLSDAQIQRIASQDFLWMNCLDVLLWWADRIQARNWATTRLLAAITGADQLARQAVGQGGTVRSILVSHSLGTAATAHALLHLADDSLAHVRSGAFQEWFTLANVAPFLVPAADVYGPRLTPGAPGSLISGGMHNVRNDLDPIPWLLPTRAFDPPVGGSQDWGNAVQDGVFRLVRTSTVLAPPEWKPEITQVHGFASYLLDPGVARRLAGVMRGDHFSDDEVQQLGVSEAQDRLPALKCHNEPSALTRLRERVEAYITAGPPVDGGQDTAPPRWIGRLLEAGELLLAARSQC